MWCAIKRWRRRPVNCVFAWTNRQSRILLTTNCRRPRLKWSGAHHTYRRPSVPPPSHSTVAHAAAASAANVSQLGRRPKSCRFRFVSLLVLILAGSYRRRLLIRRRRQQHHQQVGRVEGPRPTPAKPVDVRSAVPQWIISTWPTTRLYRIHCPWLPEPTLGSFCRPGRQYCTGDVNSAIRTSCRRGIDQLRQCCVRHLSSKGLLSYTVYFTF